MEWISVKDKEAPLYVIVLAFHVKNGIIYGYRFLDYDEDPPYSSEHAWEYCCNDKPPSKEDIWSWGGTGTCRSAEDFEVTHWMPLPNPPNKEHKETSFYILDLDKPPCICTPESGWCRLCPRHGNKTTN